MAYETDSAPSPTPSAMLQRWDTYATYTLYLNDEDKAAFLAADDPSSMVTAILAAHDAPPPNEVRVHNVSSATDNIQQELDQILKEITSGGGSTPPPTTQPPFAVLYHQESGQHISRYLTLVYNS